MPMPSVRRTETANAARAVQLGAEVACSHRHPFSQSETCAGCIVSLTTVPRSVASSSRSSSSRSRVLNVTRVRCSVVAAPVEATIDEAWIRRRAGRKRAATASVEPAIARSFPRSARERGSLEADHDPEVEPGEERGDGGVDERFADDQGRCRRAGTTIAIPAATGACRYRKEYSRPLDPDEVRTIRPAAVGTPPPTNYIDFIVARRCRRTPGKRTMIERAAETMRRKNAMPMMASPPGTTRTTHDRVVGERRRPVDLHDQRRDHRDHADQPFKDSSTPHRRPGARLGTESGRGGSKQQPGTRADEKAEAGEEEWRRGSEPGPGRARRYAHGWRPDQARDDDRATEEEDQREGWPRICDRRRYMPMVPKAIIEKQISDRATVSCLVGYGVPGCSPPNPRW